VCPYYYYCCVLSGIQYASSVSFTDVAAVHGGILLSLRTMLVALALALLLLIITIPYYSFIYFGAVVQNFPYRVSVLFRHHPNPILPP
jgi:hypothetical protein